MLKVILSTLFLVTAVSARRAGILAEGPACPLPDPLESPAALLNVTLHPLVEIFQGSQREEILVTGLSTLSYSYDVNLITLNVLFDLKIGSLKIDGNGFNVEGWIDARPLRQETLPSGNITGSGTTASFSVTDGEIKGNAVLFVNLIGNKVTIRTLNIEIASFSSLSMNFGPDYLVSGQPIDWATWNTGIKNNFDQDFAQFKDEVTEKCRLAANNVVGEYTLEELIDLISNPGGGECETAPPS